MRTDDLTDSNAALIEKLRAGDEGALRLAIDRYFSDVIAIAFHYVGTSDAAKDIAQEVFIEVWHKRDRLDPSGNLGRYLRRAARNRSLKVLRHEAAVARLGQVIAREYEVSYAHGSICDTPQFETEELVQQVRAVFETLSPRVREIALLYHEGGLEPAEIAAMLGIAPQTVYNQLQTVMRALIRKFRPSETRG